MGIMKLLAGGAEMLVGPLLGPVVIPALLLIALTTGKSAWERRDAKILKSGEMVCDAAWRDRVRKAEAEAAAAKVAAMEDLLASERSNMESLNEQLKQTGAEISRLQQASAAAGIDRPERCLSDGVLDSLRGRGDAPGRRKPVERKG